MTDDDITAAFSFAIRQTRPNRLGTLLRHVRRELKRRFPQTTGEDRTGAVEFYVVRLAEKEILAALGRLNESARTGD